MSFLLEGKVIAVTGGASGIGLAICRRFGLEGARVAVIDMNGDEASRQVKALQCSGIEATAFTCDVSREEECLQTVQSVIDVYGGVDILVNNAGLTQRSAFVDTQTAVYRKIMAVNFFAWAWATLQWQLARQYTAVVGVATLEVIFETPIILGLAWAQRRHQRKEELREAVNLAGVKQLSMAGWGLLLAGVWMNLVTALLEESPGYYTIIGNIPALLEVAALFATVVAMSMHAARV